MKGECTYESVTPTDKLALCNNLGLVICCENIGLILNLLTSIKKFFTASLPARKDRYDNAAIRGSAQYRYSVVKSTESRSPTYHRMFGNIIPLPTFKITY